MKSKNEIQPEELSLHLNNTSIEARKLPFGISTIEADNESLKPFAQSTTPDDLMRIIGATDEDFSGFNVVLQHVKCNINSAKNVASYFEKLVEVYEAHSKSVEKATNSILQTYNSKSTKQASFGCNWRELLEGQVKTADENGVFAKQLANYSNSLFVDTKRLEKDSKKLQLLSESSIKQYKECEKVLSKAKTRHESAKIDLQNHIYQNKPLNHSNLSAKAIKSYEKGLAEKTQHAGSMENAYGEALENYEIVRSELFSRTMPSLTKGLLDIDIELSEKTNQGLCSFSAGHLALAKESYFELKESKQRISRINDSKDLESYLSKFFYYSQHGARNVEEGN